MTQELSLWQSIASLNCVEGLRVEIKGEEWVSVGTGSLSQSIQFKWRPQSHRHAALLIVDAIEASSDWRFARDLDSTWWASRDETDADLVLTPIDKHYPEHLSLLTVIERVLGAIKEGKNV